MPEEKEEKKPAAIPLTDEQKERVEDPNQADETVPGGRYVVGDSVMNAQGEEIGKASKADKTADSSVETPTNKK